MTSGPVPPNSAAVPPAPAPSAAATPHASAPKRPRRYKPLPPKRLFYRHLVRHGLIGLAMVAGALFIGVCGYHWTAELGWLDSLVNASMILSGMGPVNPVPSAAGKWFESFYALFSGVVFITSVGVLLAPLAKRFLHRFHLDIEADG